MSGFDLRRLESEIMQYGLAVLAVLFGGDHNIPAGVGLVGGSLVRFALRSLKGGEPFAAPDNSDFDIIVPTSHWFETLRTLQNRGLTVTYKRDVGFTERALEVAAQLTSGPFFASGRSATVTGPALARSYDLIEYAKPHPTVDENVRLFTRSFDIRLCEIAVVRTTYGDGRNALVATTVCMADTALDDLTKRQIVVNVWKRTTADRVRKYAALLEVDPSTAFDASGGATHGGGDAIPGLRTWDPLVSMAPALPAPAAEKMTVVYVAGPYRGDVEQNVERACNYGYVVAQMGCVPLVPHAIGHAVDGRGAALPDRYWLDATAELLTRCDRMILIPGWRESSGSRAELALARQHKIPVAEVRSLTDVPALLATPVTQWPDVIE